MNGTHDNATTGAASAPKTGGGTLTAALFFICAAALSAAAFAGTRAYLVPDDALLRFVPLDAQFYLHSDGPALPKILPSSLVPDGIVPDAWAVFALPDDDERIAVGTLVSWLPFRGPDAEGRRAVNAAGGRMVAPRTYLFASDALADRVRAVALGEAPALRSERRIANGLAAMHDLFVVQGYAEPRMLASFAPTRADAEATDGLSRALGALRDVEPFVFALADRPGELVALIALLDASPRLPILGYRIPHGAARNPSSPRDPDAAVSYVDVASKVDPIAALFWTIESARRAAGIPSSEYLTTARDDLRTVLSGRVSLAIDSRSTEGRARFVARFAEASLDEVADALSRYVNASFPMKAAVSLPDSDITREYRIDANRYAFVPSATPNGRSARTITVEEYPVTIVIAPDGENGTLIATTAEDIDDYYSWNPEVRFRSCDERSAISSLHLRQNVFGMTEISIISLNQAVLLLCAQ